MTGFFRDGYCRTGSSDHGSHTVCSEVTEEFLEYTKKQGNDLSTPNSYFPGLKPGDHWCLCAARWKQAQEAGVAPTVVLEASHQKALNTCSLDLLKKHQ